MLKRTVLGGGAHSAPMLLRRGVCLQPVSRLARSLSQTAAAMQEGDTAADKHWSRKQRISLMDTFARKHLKEAGSLPTAYVLTKEFGGAKTTATKVLSQLEEEFKIQPAGDGKDEVSMNAPRSLDEDKSTSVEEANTRPTQAMKAEINKASGTKIEDAPERVVNEQTKQVDAKAREPVASLWQKLHSLTYGKPSSAPTAPVGNGKPAGSTKQLPYIKIPELMRYSSEESESESESDTDHGIPTLSFHQPDIDSNPAQPLFRTDLQPRHGLYIKFLSPQATESDVRGAFRSCGEICRVQVVRGRNPAAKYIYAFVDFATEAALKTALKKEVMIKGSKVMTEQANGHLKAREKPPQKQESDSESDAEAPKSRALTAIVPKSDAVDVTADANALRPTLAVENIPHASLPQVLEALSQYGEVVNSRMRQYQGGNTTAFIEFKNECDKDNALAASKVLLGGKTLRMSRIDAPPTTVVRLSNIPAEARERIASMYKSYGQVDKVDSRMDGVLDIYYSGSELKNMPRILDKLNAIHVSKKKLRAVPAPISYPKTLAETAETTAGYKWIESQRELVTKSLEISLKKAAMYTQDLQELLKLQQGAPQVKSVASN